MSVAAEVDLKQYCLQVARRAKAASSELARVSGAAKNAWLRGSAARRRENAAEIVAANANRSFILCPLVDLRRPLRFEESTSSNALNVGNGNFCVQPMRSAKFT